MEAIKLTWYQIFFNNQFGYRNDYKASFWYYIHQYVKRYLIDIWYHTNGVKKPYRKEVAVKGPRGGWTGRYKTTTIPISKATCKNLKITFLPWTWVSFTLQFKWSNYVFTVYTFSFRLDKLKWTIEINLNNN